MKNGALVVLKKELARFFGDKRLFFTTVIMPGLLIFVMYNVKRVLLSSGSSHEPGGPPLGNSEVPSVWYNER